MSTLATLHRILVANELGGHPGLAYKFSDPDGPERSGYSFGVCQFDLRHNRHAYGALVECGFAQAEIDSLVEQTCDALELVRLNAKLLGVHATVDRLDAEEIGHTVSHVRWVIMSADLLLATEEVFFHLADYHNQFFLDFNGRAVRHFRPFGRPITADDVLSYKLSTAWGQKRPDDVKRRWANIVKICTETEPAACACLAAAGRFGHCKGEFTTCTEPCWALTQAKAERGARTYWQKTQPRGEWPRANQKETTR